MAALVIPIADPVAKSFLARFLAVFGVPICKPEANDFIIHMEYQSRPFQSYLANQIQRALTDSILPPSLALTVTPAGACFGAEEGRTGVPQPA